MKNLVLLLIVIVFSGFISQTESEWKEKYNSMKEERDMYKQASEMLLKNWKECEQKVTKILD